MGKVESVYFAEILFVLYEKYSIFRQDFNFGFDFKFCIQRQFFRSVNQRRPFYSEVFT